MDIIINLLILNKTHIVRLMDFGLIDFIWFLHKWDGSASEMVARHEKLDNARDLENQTFYKFIRKTYFLHSIALAVILLWHRRHSLLHLGNRKNIYLWLQIYML